MTRDEIVLYEVFNFKGSNFYCPDCFNKHPDAKDWIKKGYTQKNPLAKDNVVCCGCKKKLAIVGRIGEEEERKEIPKNSQRGVGSRE
jgi:hypothetical protein